MISLDDGRILRLTKAKAAEMSICEGCAITEDEISLVMAHGGLMADEQAATLLARRQYSAYEIASKLADYGYNDVEISDAVAKLKLLRILDDEAYAQYVVEECSRKFMSSRAASYELSRRGIDESIAEDALVKLIPAEDALEMLISNNYGDEQLDRAAVSKLYPWLSGKGFTASEISAALASRRACMEY